MNDLDTLLAERCSIVVPDTSILSQEEFALARRVGLGASDISVVLGLQSQWKTAGDIILNKLESGYTEEEQMVSRKTNVRIGRELEPMVLDIASETVGPLIKPKPMYRPNEYPYLTINYDGVTSVGQIGIPVEAKVCTLYGDKYYNFKKADNFEQRRQSTGCRIQEVCKEAAEQYGIPVYYYAQVQQQMLGTDAEWAWLAVLRLKDCKVYLFRIPASPYVQNAIIIEGAKIWDQIERRRDNGTKS